MEWIKLSEPLEVSKDPDYGLVFELRDALSDEALIRFENKLENKLLNYRV